MTKQIFSYSKRFVMENFQSPYDPFQLSPLQEAVWNPLDSVDELDFIERELDASMFVETLEETVSEEDPILTTDASRVGKGKIYGMEVGDDVVNVSDSELGLRFAIKAQSSIFGMKTSEEDTYISPFDWNFCEVTSQIPKCTEESFLYARRNNQFAQLGFTDVPPLRIIIDVQKTDRSHSSSSTGKSKLLGDRMRATKGTHKAILNLASWIQDGCLNTRNNPEPKYMDNMYGGSGAPPLWDVSSNTYLYLKEYKGGAYSRVYGSAINEVKGCLRSISLGTPKQPVLCTRLRDKQEYLHVTFDRYIAVDHAARDDELLPTPLHNGVGSDLCLQAVDTRLMQCKLILPRSYALVEVKRSRRVGTTLFGLQNILMADLEEKRISKLLRSKYDGARNANAAVSRLLLKRASWEDYQKLVNDGWLSIDSGVRDLTRELSDWMVEGSTDGVITGRDLRKSQPAYRRDEVSLERYLRVGGIHLRPRDHNFVVKPAVSSSKVGLWMISETKLEWAENILTQLTEHRDALGSPASLEYIRGLYKSNLEWVSDDTNIVSSVTDLLTATKTVAGHILIVTSDKKLANRCADTTGLPVVTVNPLDIVVNEVDGVIDASDDNIGLIEAAASKYYVQEDVGPVVQIHIDTGSLSSSSTRVERVELSSGVETFTKSLNYSRNLEGFRSASYIMTMKPRSPSVRGIIHWGKGRSRLTKLIKGVPYVKPAEYYNRFRSDFYQRKR